MFKALDCQGKACLWVRAEINGCMSYMHQGSASDVGRGMLGHTQDLRPTGSDHEKISVDTSSGSTADQRCR